MICEHAAQESDSGVSLLKDFGCFHLIGEEVSGANPQDKGILGLGVLLLCGTLDVTPLGGFLIKEKHLS